MGTSMMSPPEHITLVYKEISGSHSFSAVEYPNFVVWNHDLKEAFDCSVDGLGNMVTYLCGFPVAYSAEKTFEEFESSLNDVSDAGDLLPFILRTPLENKMVQNSY